MMQNRKLGKQCLLRAAVKFWGEKQVILYGLPHVQDP